MNQRDVFEKWCKYEGVKLHDEEADLCWNAWQAATESQWQWHPIDTAPLDGTPVLSVVQGFQPTVAEFQNGFWIYYDEQCTLDSEYNPTHWMPLPPAP